MFKNIITFFKYQKIIKKVFNETEFIRALNMSFGVTFKQDKIHRLYTVINPYIQNMNDEGNTIIYDANNKPVVERWVLANFDIISKVIMNHQLFDLLSYDIQQLDDDLNFSLVIQNAMWPYFKRSIKKLGLILLSLVIIGVLLMILL